jgi:large subunit ribosomal protein LP2
MRHIAAYAMLVLGGKDAPTAAEVEKVVKDAGAEADKEKCAALVEALKGKEFHELVEVGMKTLSSMGGGAPAAAAGGAGAAKVEAVKEEEPEEEVDIGGMFGDEDEY